MNTATRMRRSVSIAALALTVTLGMSAVPAEGSAFNHLSGMLSLQMNARFDVLTAKAQMQGTVRVIVHLKPARSVKETPATMNVRAYRASIASTQSQVISQLVQPVAVTKYPSLPYMAMEVDAMDLAALRQSPEIKAVFEDHLRFPVFTNSMPLVGASQTATKGYSGAGQTIAIVDSGVDKTHPDLAGKVIYEACFSSVAAGGTSSGGCPNGQSSMTGEGAAVPCQGNVDCWHGTHVAAIAAGRQGVARDANIIAMRVSSKFNSAADCYPYRAPCTAILDSDILAALNRIYGLSISGQFNIAAANLSLGGGRFTGACNGYQGVPAINNLYAAGIATVVASGNEGYKNGIGAPACVSQAVSVGATDQYDFVPNWSNSGLMLDLLAPGVGIRSAVPGGGYAPWPGTSMAAPHVAGAFAVLKGAAPQASVDSLLGALRTTGVPVMDSANAITRQRINIDRALTAIGRAARATAPASMPVPGLP